VGLELNGEDRPDRQGRLADEQVPLKVQAVRHCNKLSTDK